MESEYQIIRRTFEAKKYPKGSAERTQLNTDSVTSEYMPSYRYTLIDPVGRVSYRTRAEAVAAVEALRPETQRHGGTMGSFKDKA